MPGPRSMQIVAAGDVAYVATDVGLWMALPAFGPALLIVGVVLYVIRRDRHSNPGADAFNEPQPERNDVE